MELNHYPTLKDHLSASEIVTPHGTDLLIYNTTTGEKKQCNEAVMDFLRLSTGTRTFEEIVRELSLKSGDQFEQIWPGLSKIATQMVNHQLLEASHSPLETSRKPPPSVRLVHRLVNVSFEVTRKCNLSCRHCYANAGERLKDELAVGEIKAFIDQLAAMGVLSITFSGGEPLLHPHLFELMEYARRKPLSVLLFTNGTLLTRKIVQTLKEIGVLNVSVSIDGPDAETHDLFRGVKGSFEKTIRGVKLLREAGIPVRCSMSITKINYKRVKEMLELVNDLQLSEVKMWFIAFSGRPDEKQIFISPEEFREVMKQNREYEKEAFGERKVEVQYRRTPENCGIGMSSLGVKCNGVVVPCPNFGEDVSLGNIRNDSLPDIWNTSVLLNELRAMSVLKTERCKDCDYALLCKGGCLADVYGRTGAFSCHDEYKCIAVEVTKDTIIPVEVEDTFSRSLSVEIS